jgi:hypothetical protein
MLEHIDAWVDVLPSGRRATTRPEPTRPEKRKPACKIRSKGLYRLQYLENSDDGKALGIGEDRGRDDFVRAKGLSRINEPAHNLVRHMHPHNE